MKEYITKSSESPQNQKLINEALSILDAVGIPFKDKTPNGLEKMAMCFLAVAGVESSWKKAMGQNEDRHLTPRQIIKYINEHFEKKISSGSYDDVRRTHLKLMTMAELVLKSSKNPGASTNDPTSGYCLHSEFTELIRFFNTDQWEIKLKLFQKNWPSLSEILERKRNLPKIPIVLPNGTSLDFSKGGHNQLQREVIEEFLPRFGPGSQVLYIGDAANRFAHKLDEELSALGLIISDEELPDIIAYDKKRNWLFLIEAFYSSGPMSEERIFELQKLLKNCTAEPIFVTAFISRADFKKNILDIAWETEVWTADNPDHLVHFNGDKFLGPYKPG